MSKRANRAGGRASKKWRGSYGDRRTPLTRACHCRSWSRHQTWGPCGIPFVRDSIAALQHPVSLGADHTIPVSFPPGDVALRRVRSGLHRHNSHGHIGPCVDTAARQAASRLVRTRSPTSKHAKRAGG
jgi:hypothetical protein